MGTARAGTRWRDFGPAIALLIVGMLGIVAATLSPTGRYGQYAVVAPPWYGAGQTIALIRQAGGGIADVGGPANIVIAHSDDPRFVRALYKEGAWLVVDPMQLRGCVGAEPKTQADSEVPGLRGPA